MTAATRLHIVADAAALQLVNDTLQAVDAGNVGPLLTVPLRKVGSADDPSSNGVAYGASWALSDLMLRGLHRLVRNAAWRPTIAETTVYGSGQVEAKTVPAFGSQRIWLFDGGGAGTSFPVSFDDALLSMILQRPYNPSGG